MITEKDKKEIVLRKSNEDGRVFALILDDNGPDSLVYTIYASDDIYITPAMYISDSMPEDPESKDAKRIIEALEGPENLFELTIHPDLPENWEDRA